MSELQLPDKQKRVQQKIKLMLKNKKLQKLTSEKDLVSQKPISINNDKLSKRFDQFSTKGLKFTGNQMNYRQEETFDNTFDKKIKSNTEIQQMSLLGSVSFKQSLKKFKRSNKQLLFDQTSKQIQKTPSAQKISNLQSDINQFRHKPKRPSSVLHKPSSRTTTSRSRRISQKSIQNKKEIQQKIQQYILKAFEFGIKLQKFAQQLNLNIQKQKQFIFNEQINLLKLINNCRKYFDEKNLNQEQDQRKLTAYTQKQIIQAIKKKRKKQQISNKCDNITSQLSKLIENRLSILKKSKIADY